ncbi:MAG: phospholipase D family protein [Spirochaetales bacterium]|nr:phospholipase D family protein [Spirochaetales bacterium]
MARFLTTASTTSAVEDIINNARNNLVLISPYVKIPRNLFQNLLSADSKGINTTLIYGKKMDIDQEAKEQISALRHISVYFLENLHAKCYLNEESMVITSMNLYDFSERNNREMGIYLTRKDDSEIYNQAFDEYKRILSLAKSTKPTEDYVVTGSTMTHSAPLQKYSANKLKVQGTGSILSRPISELFGGKKGYCIRCKKRTDYDLNKPFCKECYPQVKQNQQNYKANYCFECGARCITTLAQPLCNTCYKKLRR